jgi:hypothetical protein
MAAVGATIVFSGVVVWSFVISQIHILLKLWDDREKLIERFKKRPRLLLLKKSMPLFTRNATCPQCFQKGTHDISGGGRLAVLLSGSDRTATAGDAVFRKLLKECGAVNRLANTAQSAVVDTATIFFGFTVGCSTQVDVFLTPKSLGIFFLGAVAFSIATASGLIFAKAVPGSAREVHLMGLKEDPTNFLLMHGMACNSSGVIGSAICAGILWSFFV